LLSQQELCDAAVNFICVPKFTAASRGPPCDSVASCFYFAQLEQEIMTHTHKKYFRL